jgi:hypothetical protein
MVSKIGSETGNMRAFGLAMNRDQNLLAGIGKAHQLAQSDLGFTKGGNHLAAMVLF